MNRTKYTTAVSCSPDVYRGWGGIGILVDGQAGSVHGSVGTWYGA